MKMNINISYYFLLDENQKIIGSGATPDGTFPARSIICSQEQATTPSNWMVSDGKIIQSSKFLDNLKSKKFQILSTSCKQQILNGFESSATGNTLTYASGETDQRNIILAATVPGGGLIACKDSSGNWSRKLHSQTESQKVTSDLVSNISNISNIRNRLSKLEEQVNLAKTEEDLNNITW